MSMASDYNAVVPKSENKKKNYNRRKKLLADFLRLLNARKHLEREQAKCKDESSRRLLTSIEKQRRQRERENNNNRAAAAVLRPSRREQDSDRLVWNNRAEGRRNNCQSFAIGLKRIFVRWKKGIFLLSILILHQTSLHIIFGLVSFASRRDPTGFFAV